jgi:hypothetical protein
MTGSAEETEPTEEPHLIASADGVLTWRLLRPVGPRQISEVQRRLNDMSARGSGNVSLLVVVSPFRWIPNGPTRQAATTLLQEFASTLRAVAVVFEARGFGAATLRAVMAAMTAAVKRPFAIKVCGDMSDAVAWLADGSPMTTDELLRQVERGIGLEAPASPVNTEDVDREVE